MCTLPCFLLHTTLLGIIFRIFLAKYKNTSMPLVPSPFILIPDDARPRSFQGSQHLVVKEEVSRILGDKGHMFTSSGLHGLDCEMDKQDPKSWGGDQNRN